MQHLLVCYVSLTTSLLSSATVLLHTHSFSAIALNGHITMSMVNPELAKFQPCNHILCLQVLFNNLKSFLALPLPKTSTALRR